jgi:hypothetical protein
MEPEDSLPCPQEPTTGPYPEQDESFHENQSNQFKSYYERRSDK